MLSFQELALICCNWTSCDLSEEVALLLLYESDFVDDIDEGRRAIIDVVFLRSFQNLFEADDHGVFQARVGEVLLRRT